MLLVLWHIIAGKAEKPKEVLDIFKVLKYQMDKIN